MAETLDAVVVGSGPNGLVAANQIAPAGYSVRVLEAREEIGGGLHSSELTLPGFLHDVCSGCHPMGVLSPVFRDLPLEEHGLRWAYPAASVAHPLDDQPAVLLRRSVADTAEELGRDRAMWGRVVRPFLRNPDALLADLLAPLGIPGGPLRMAAFGALGLWPATVLGGALFREERARALLAGCAAHSILPLNSLLTGAVGMIFALTGHLVDWPVAVGGSRSIALALSSYLRSLGGEIVTASPVASLRDLPPSRIVLFDTAPAGLLRIAGDALPEGYRRRLGRYRYGPGAFKLDWALDGPIPWRDPRVLEASTVHIGGTLAEVAAAEADVWKGKHPERPFVLLVQQSQFDATRAPEGRHTGYAYCHVPPGSDLDLTDVLERQIERFAPGFRDRILARHATTTADFHAMNENYIGGAITGGVADLGQFFARPVARLDPYSTPNPRLFLCSASTPPGGGVHGMCGYWAAESVKKRLGG